MSESTGEGDDACFFIYLFFFPRRMWITAPAKTVLRGSSWALADSVIGSRQKSINGPLNGTGSESREHVEIEVEMSPR